MRNRILTLLLLGGSCVASAQVQVSTTLETYFMTRKGTEGIAHRISWGELSVRFNPNVKATVSMTQLPTMDMLDEAYVAAENDLGVVRVGRFRTSFGLSDWSEYFYNGFNHIPMLTINPLTTGVRLLRDDTGVEATWELGGVQAQAALIDSQSDIYQLGPQKVRHGSLRLQKDVANAVIGVDVLKSLNDQRDVYGFDLRWAVPHFLVKGEAMQGAGSSGSKGYTLDVAYRPPKLARTQVVGRTERFEKPGRGDYSLHTVGLRQIVDPHLSVNLNYGWANRSSSTYTPNGSLTGWSVQTMFQVRF